MIIDWPSDFGTWLDQLDVRAESGDSHAQQVQNYVIAALVELQALTKAPTRDEETASLKWVRQSKRYQVWRTSSLRRRGRGPDYLLLPARKDRHCRRGALCGRQSVHGRRFLRQRRKPCRSADRPMVSTSKGAVLMSDDHTFVHGNEHLARLVAKPRVAEGAAKARAEIREMDRAHAMSLAMIRKAGELTQLEMAERLGIGQGTVSRLENRSDMLLSTLFGYLTAAGAETARIVVSMHGQEVDLDLSSLTTTDH